MKERKECGIGVGQAASVPDIIYLSVVEPEERRRGGEPGDREVVIGKERRQRNQKMERCQWRKGW